MSGELAVPVMQQIAWEIVVGDAQIAELLCRPDAIKGVRDVPEDEPARPNLDKEEDVVGS